MNDKAKRLAVILGVSAAVIGTALAGSAYMRKSIQEDRIEMTRKSIECEALKRPVLTAMFGLAGYPTETMEILLKSNVEDGTTYIRSGKIVSALIPMRSSWANTSEADRDIAIWSLGSKICMNM